MLSTMQIYVIIRLIILFCQLNLKFSDGTDGEINIMLMPSNAV